MNEEKKNDGILIGLAEKKVFIRSSEIKQVLQPIALTTVPMGPEHIIGLANIQGQIVCMIDVGGVCSLPLCHRQATARTRFLLLRHAVMHVGIWVDEVYKMQQINAGELAQFENHDESVHCVEIDGNVCDYLQCAKLLQSDACVGEKR